MTTIEQLQEKLKGFFHVEDINHINHNPHPFMIGPKHIAFASDNYNGMLGDACLNDKRCPPCAVRGCNLSYSDHKSNKVAFLKLLKNIPSQEAQDVLATVEDICKKEGIEGFVFVETKEKFRITK